MSLDRAAMVPPNTSGEAALRYRRNATARIRRAVIRADILLSNLYDDLLVCVDNTQTNIINIKAEKTRNARCGLLTVARWAITSNADDAARRYVSSRRNICNA